MDGFGECLQDADGITPTGECRTSYFTIITIGLTKFGDQNPTTHLLITQGC